MSNVPPPPARRSRTFKEMKEDIKKLEEENARLRAIQDKKEKPTAETIQQRNPNRTNPNVNAPVIKLLDYSTDWIEQERSNVVVELNEHFEDEIIKPHSRVVQADNLSLLGLDDNGKRNVVKGYESFCVLNLSYRLLMTLPASYRLEAKSLLDSIKATEIPQNTAVYNEMLSHIGKTKTESYGNLRLTYPLQLAKKKICKAMCLVSDNSFLVEELQLSNSHTLDELKEVYNNGVFIDKDAPDFVASQAMKFLDSQSEFKAPWTNDGDNHRMCWMFPDRHMQKFFKKGRYTPTVAFVRDWVLSCRTLKYLDDDSNGFKDLYFKLGSCMFAQIINLEFMKNEKTIHELFPEFNLHDFRDAKWEDIAQYMGISVLDDYVTTDQLSNNYFILMDYYSTSVEKHVKSVFKLSPIKKDEFGSEAQMLICSDWQKDANNAVDSAFKVSDRNKAVAAGIFNFTKKVDTTVSDRMYLKNSFRSIISNLIANFTRK